MIENNPIEIDEVLHRLQKYIENEQFKGYDPIDIFNTFLPIHILPTFIKVVISQLHLRNPINLRPFLGIKKEYNPMTLGVLLKAYALQYEMQKSADTLETMQFLFTRLVDSRSNGYNGFCWGNNFDWVGRDGIVPKDHPNLVTTSKVADGIFEFLRVTKDEKAIETFLDVKPFILKDLPRIETAEGICFSYTNLKKEACYNANMFAAEILAKIYSLSGEVDILKLAEAAVAFTMFHQHEDGHWNYSVDLKSGVEREQIDFHQGYILCSLDTFLKYSRSESVYQKQLIKGIKFYKDKQFFEDGRAKWRFPKTIPIETHHHAIGIITFAEMNYLDKEYLDFAYKIAGCAIKNMLAKKGYFYFRKYKHHINKISYIRWTQSFMLLALMVLKRKKDENN